MPLAPELIESFKEQEAEFLETFGRKPGRYDPVFFHKYYMSETDMRRDMIKIMKAAGTPASLVYAYRKTDRMVTKKSLNMLTAAERAEWDAAIDEYYDRIEDGEDVDVFSDGGGLSDLLSDALRKNQMVGGSFISHHFNRYRRRKGANSDVESVVAFAATNFVRSLKSVHILIEQDVAFDAYHLARSMYENYLTVRYIYHRPRDSEVFFAQLGTLLGTHKLAESKNGAPISSEIIELEWGKRCKVPSRWAMASTLGGVDQTLYQNLYRTLSSYAHSEITNIGHFLSDDGFDYLSQNFALDVLATCHLLCMLFFSTLKQHSPCAAYLRGDLSTIAGRSLFAVYMVKEALAEQGRTLPPVYDTAIASMIAADARLAKVSLAINQTN